MTLRNFDEAEAEGTVVNGDFALFLIGLGDEGVAGEANGVSEVKAVGEIRADGTLVNSSEYLKNGKWEPSHGATCRKDPKAEVIFK